MSDDPKCSSCGAWGPSGHRCPKKYACVDCGKAADMFVAETDTLVFDDADMMKQVTADPDNDKPLCDSCYYLRAKTQAAPRLN